MGTIYITGAFVFFLTSFFVTIENFLKKHEHRPAVFAWAAFFNLILAVIWPVYLPLAPLILFFNKRKGLYDR